MGQVAGVGYNDLLNHRLQPGLADLGTSNGKLFRAQIGETHMVAALRQPDCVASGAAADIEHPCICGQVGGERMVGEFKLDCAIVGTFESCPFSFAEAGIVGADVVSVYGLAPLLF